MTGRLQQRLTDEFHEYAAGVRLDTDVLGAAASRHHRRTNVRRAVTAGGVLGVAAVLSGVLVLSDTGQPPRAGDRPVASAPALQLAAAVQATTRSSFGLGITVTRSYETGRLKGYTESSEYQGAFDAGADRGYLRIGPTRVRGKAVGTPVPIEVRIIGDDVFVGRPDTNVWKRQVKRSDLAVVLGTATPATSSLVNDLTVDPRVLLETLRTLGSTTPAGRSGSGSAAVDTYTFSYPVAADASTAEHQVTGVVEVGADSQLLARIVQETTTTGADPSVADRQPLSWRTVITFADYGTAVQVDRPVPIGN
ncbi:hypothetical protein [Actinoplanes awajinensis]|uniref:Uncharacterized protein n=1 Tax=Actinoplanes awajinensis subsp. mycoplanecinus TaxID=135947 RepID=A0A0X3VAW3_9ACTN|nr:hypothetical protein [Actinoplanes awajinensis]KUL41943.1 hypothetical protein ADL15_02755 [Actinoplanes awajinensis subsp. mycoplanecinus]